VNLFKPNYIKKDYFPLGSWVTGERTKIENCFQIIDLGCYDLQI
jgi:hypothetical protein